MQPHLCSIPPKKMYLSAWKCITLYFSTPKYWIFLVEHQCNPQINSISRTKLYFTALEFFKLISKLPSIDFPLVEHQCNPHPYSISQTISILLLGNLFQLVFKLSSIDLLLVGHHSNPHPCSVSQNKLFCTDGKIVSNLFINWQVLIWYLLSTNATPSLFKINEQAVFYCLKFIPNDF